MPNETLDVPTEPKVLDPEAVDAAMNDVVLQPVSSTEIIEGDGPLSPEQKSRLLTPDFMASLSEAEYMALWRRLNPYFVSHVTRQGFRDHNAMIYHTGGMETYSTGFTSMLEDDKALRPPLAVGGLPHRDESTVKRFLTDHEVLAQPNVEEARKRAHDLLYFSMGAAPSYPDRTAVHLAAEMVADSHYGGETGNEIFVVYPSDFIASQYPYYFNGQERDFTHPQSEDKWNDVFVWPPDVENPEIPLDAGIVFLPKSTDVDPETGSVYASKLVEIDGQTVRVMVPDQENIDKFMAWWNGEQTGNATIDKVRVQDGSYPGARPPGWFEHGRDDLIATLTGELVTAGFEQEIAQVLGKELVDTVGWHEETPDIMKEQELSGALKEVGLYWKKPANTVTAEQYWERYFAEHPEQRPKHIRYYDGDPSGAVYALLGKAFVGSSHYPEDRSLLGFETNHVDDISTDPVTNAGLQELEDMIAKIIDEQNLPPAPKRESIDDGW